MKIRIKNPFSREEREAPENGKEDLDNDHDIAHVMANQVQVSLESPSRKSVQKRFPFLGRSNKEKKKQTEDTKVKTRNPIAKLAFNLLGGRLPSIPQYKEIYEQAGMPLVYEAYLSTGLLLGFIAIIPTFIISLLLEIRFFPHAQIPISFLGSLILGGVIFSATLLLWLTYPIFRRRSFKSALENHLAYSFGILGVLAAAGMTLDRLFERIASSESNPVLAELAKRFLRDVRLFGMDSESALREVATHSPSAAFSGMLESIAVAYKTTGTIHDLVMFESSRLLQEKGDNLRRAIASLAVMAELYITLVVVGPIIFIVMLSIFGLLPTGGLPDPIFLINLIVFIGIPVISVVFVILLDSVVAKS